MKLVAEARRLIGAVKGVSQEGIRQEVRRALAAMTKEERTRLRGLAVTLILQVREIDREID